MIKVTKGFTIVELLIVVVVIAILAAITVVAYNGIQDRTLQSARIDEVRKWERLLISYATLKGQYPPAMVPGSACLGEGYPDTSGNGVGNCWDLHVAGHTSENASLNAQLREVGSLPNNTRQPVVGNGTSSRLGPALEMTSGGSYRIIYWMKGLDPCPIGIARWADSVSRACQLNLPPVNT